EQRVVVSSERLAVEDHQVSLGSRGLGLGRCAVEHALQQGKADDDPARASEQGPSGEPERLLHGHGCYSSRRYAKRSSETTSSSSWSKRRWPSWKDRVSLPIGSASSGVSLRPRAKRKSWVVMQVSKDGDCTSRSASWPGPLKFPTPSSVPLPLMRQVGAFTSWVRKAPAVS